MMHFISSLAPDLLKFIEFKQSRGSVYGKRIVRRLRSFDRFVAHHSTGSRKPRLKHLITKWLACKEGRHPETVRCELSTIRQFCLFLRRRDPKVFVPDLSLGPTWKQIPRHKPYIYSIEEVNLLLDCADELAPAFRGLTIRTMIVMLYCTGIRPGEALRLQIQDVNLKTKALLVRKSKGKTRWVPFHDDLKRCIHRYISERKKITPAFPASSLFSQPNGRPYSDITICQIIRELLHKSGLKPSRGRQGPRLYDLRHTHATHVLIRWYKEGKDLHAMLPLLSAYMGHDHLLGTQVYLTATPELLEVASRRFEDRFHTKRGP